VAWSACGTPSTSTPGDDGCTDGVATTLDPNQCCPAGCTEGQECDLRVFECTQLDDCINGKWNMSGLICEGGDSGALPLRDGAAEAGDDGARADVMANGDAIDAEPDAASDAPPDVSVDAPAD
jgi:hypothetical protein